MHVEARRVPALDPQALAEALDALDGKVWDCAVIVASEDEPVVAAVERATRRGIVVMTLVSDLPGSARRHFVGIDNVAAGRTAASLLGRFCARGKIAVIAGSMHLRDHRERLDGFRAVLAADFPHLELLEPVEGHDETEETRRRAAQLIAASPALSGLYNLGAGNAGLVAALDASGRAGGIRVVAHELSAPTRSGLKSGTIDVVIANEEDAELSLGIRAPESDVEAGTLNIGGYEQVARQVVSAYPNVKKVAITLRESVSASAPGGRRCPRTSTRAARRARRRRAWRRGARAWSRPRGGRW
jgi:LacI family transcriptional regulator